MSTLTIVNSTASNQTLASTTNSTLGLEITLSLNATDIAAGQTINITLAARNVLPTTLTLPTGVQDWKLTALGDEGDDYGYCVGASPFALQIFAGHLTESNVTLGAPVNVDLKNTEVGCSLHIGSDDTFEPLVNERALTDSTDGYNINGNQLLFAPGPYTVVAGDRWGQLVVLNFLVDS